MCGIAGQFGQQEAGFAERARVELRRRGPDGDGVWCGGKATLVHTRLAILDLSDAGAQPMVWKKQAEGEQASEHVLVFNGEIYNYRELRKELEALGEHFTSDSDTEVVLRLLVREGERALGKLAGMFAIAFWDAAKDVGLLARDALGIKPLYVRESAEVLAFASEARVLIRENDATDDDALRDYFEWGSVPEPATLSRAVRQLPAGHLLKWKSGSPPCRMERWDGWSLGKGVAPADPVRATREALMESVRRHLVSDVPVGVFLSGGIDSTAILALVREALGAEADIRTFSIGFDDPAFDESSLARRTAEHFGARHTEWLMTPEEGAAEIPAFLEAMDQPSIDGFNTWCVSKLAKREGMKVVLSGLGGDEWFAGYSSFERVPWFRKAHRLLGPLRLPVACVLAKRPPGSPWRRFASFLRGDSSWLGAYQVQRGIFTAEEAALLAEKFTCGNSVRKPREETGWPDDPRDVVSLLELTRYMRNQLLRDSDVYSMAHGLELRVPFVDVRLAESLSSIPAGVRLRQGKQLLLEALPEIPEWVRNQPKRGFRFPFQQWMEGHFGDLLAEANRVSPVRLDAWYRTWAVAAAMRKVKSTFETR